MNKNDNWLGEMYVESKCELFKKYASKQQWDMLEIEVKDFYLAIMKYNALKKQ